MRRAAWLCVLAALVLVTGCGEEEWTAPAPPTNFSATAGDAVIVVSWDPSPDADQSDFVGYNVYISTEPIASLGSDEVEEYKVNSSPLSDGDSPYEITSDASGQPLQNGQVYYVHMRSVGEHDGSYEAGDPTEEIEVTVSVVVDPPQTLTYITGEEDVQLIWTPSPDATNPDFLGYYVYMSTDPTDLDTISPSTPLVSDTTVTISGLSQDIRYYFAVRSAMILDGDTVLSVLSDYVHTSPVVFGEGMLVEYISDSTSGFDFSEGVALELTLANEPYIDIYLGTLEGDTTGRLALKSPHLLGDDWTLQSEIVRLGTDQLDDYPEAPETGWTPSNEAISGYVYAIKTPDNHYLKLKITATGSTSEGYRTISFSYAYQTIVGYDHF